jgi:3-methyladenine DNA glycosylase AlkD
MGAPGDDAAWPDTAVRALCDAFAPHRDPEGALLMERYMKRVAPFLGIRAPLRRRLQRDALGALGRPTGEQVLDAADRLWALPEREYHYAAADLIRRHAPLLGGGDLPRLERLVTTTPWWDTVDQLAVAAGSIVRRDRAARATMEAWLHSPDMWLVRVAILHQERWGPDTDAGWLFRACALHAARREFFVRKAIGWALRSYAAHDPAAVCRFVEDNLDRLSGLSIREAMRGVERAERSPPA